VSRKNPSFHSDEQFALFVGEVEDGRDEFDEERFDEILRNLVGVDRSIVNDSSDLLENWSSVAVASSPTGAAPASEPVLLSLFGQIALKSADTRRLLKRVLALLLGTDELTGDLVLAHTKQTPIDLIGHLVKIKVSDRQMRNELAEIVAEFSKARPLHEKLFQDYSDNDALESANRRALEPQYVSTVTAAYLSLADLSRRLRDLMPCLMNALARAPTEAAAD
jgi:hypothetical protein